MESRYIPLDEISRDIDMTSNGMREIANQFKVYYLHSLTINDDFGDIYCAKLCAIYTLST
jgi:hypothetical protein